MPSGCPLGTFLSPLDPLIVKKRSHDSHAYLPTVICSNGVAAVKLSGTSGGQCSELSVLCGQFSWAALELVCVSHNI